MNIKAAIQPAIQFVGKNAPTICAGVGCAGVVVTAVLAVKETPKALKKLEKAKLEKGGELSVVEKAVACAPCYIPAAISGVATCAFILTGNRVSVKRLATMAILYSSTERAANEIEDKVEELFGEKGVQQIKDRLQDDKMTQHDVRNCEVVRTGFGETLCYDTLSGRYFLSDVEHIRQIQNDFNHQLISNCWMCLNDFYEMLNLDWIAVGDDIGWNVDKMLEINFTAKVAANNEPCIVLDYAVMPKYDYIS